MHSFPNLAVKYGKGLPSKSIANVSVLNILLCSLTGMLEISSSTVFGIIPEKNWGGYGMFDMFPAEEEQQIGTNIKQDIDFGKI